MGINMSQSIIGRNLFSISVLMSAVLCTAAWAVPVEYRNPTDGRAWAAASADELVRWQWADGAVSAEKTHGLRRRRQRPQDVLRRPATVHGLSGVRRHSVLDVRTAHSRTYRFLRDI